ncbi:MAG: helix-turn-helix domain-containing protein [Chthonomonadales bacterium]
MSTGRDPAELDEILAQCEKEIQDEGCPNLKKWLTQYPQYRDEIMEYCAFSQAFEAAQELPVDPEVEAGLLEAAQRALQEVRLHPFGGGLAGLLQRAHDLRITAADLAARLGIGRSVLAKLDRRLIRPDTVPRALVDRLAVLLREPVEWILEYLQLPPGPARNSSYRAFDEPRVWEPAQEYRLLESWALHFERAEAYTARQQHWSVQEPFEKAVRSARDMTKEQKAQWLPPA